MRHVEELINQQLQRHYILQEQMRARRAEGEAHRQHPAICISRDLGSGAREIARGLCETLHYELFGSAIIDEIARDLDVQRRLIDGLDESGRSELDIMLKSFLQGREIDGLEYMCSLARVIRTLAMQGGALILGRGSAFVLGERSAINLLIIGPLEQRVRRLMGYDGVSEAEARKRITEADRARSRFVRHHFQADVNDPRHYDLTLNTGRMAPADAVGVVLEALGRLGHPIDELRMPMLEHSS